MTLGMGGNQGALGSPRSSSGSLLEARFSREQCPAAAPRVLQDSVWEKGSAGLIKKAAHQPSGFRSGATPDPEEGVRMPSEEPN